MRILYPVFIFFHPDYFDKLNNFKLFYLSHHLIEPLDSRFLFKSIWKDFIQIIGEF